jgi:hypothetical protein
MWGNKGINSYSVIIKLHVNHIVKSELNTQKKESCEFNNNEYSYMIYHEHNSEGIICLTGTNHQINMVEYVDGCLLGCSTV